MILHNLQITDFGNYSCVADNGLGIERDSLLVSGVYNVSYILLTSDTM